MGFELTIAKSGIAKGLSTGEVQKQLTFAIASALTKSVKDVQKDVRGRLPTWVKMTRPKFLTSQLHMKPANKQNLTAYLGFSKAVKLAELMENGGRYLATGRSIAIPTQNVKRSGRGAVTKANRPTRLATKKNVFNGTIRGTTGLWEKKPDGTLMLLYHYEQAVRYKGRNFRFLPTSQKTFNRVIQGHTITQINKAFATARR